jgi:hypothetical protein
VACVPRCARDDADATLQLLCEVRLSPPAGALAVQGWVEAFAVACDFGWMTKRAAEAETLEAKVEHVVREQPLPPAAEVVDAGDEPDDADG